MKLSIRMALLAAAVVASGGGAYAQVKVTPDQRFAVIEVVRLNNLVKELNDVGKQGFQLKRVAMDDENKSVRALVERVATKETYEYRAVSTVTSKAADKEMNANAAEGFRVVPHSLMVKKGLTIFNIERVVVMEKASQGPAAYEYKTVEIGTSPAVDGNLKGAMADGWQISEMLFELVLLERVKR